jgi:MSHA biogenesis protein MshQ
MMRRLLLLVGLLLSLPVAFAQTCTSIATGNWNAPATWNCSAGTVPTATTAVTIANLTHTVTVTASASAASVTFNGGNRSATLTVNAGVTLSVSGNVTVNAPTNNVTKRITLSSTPSGAGGAQLLIGGNLVMTEGTTGNTAELLIQDNSASLVTVGGSINLTANGGNAPNITFGGQGTLRVAGDFSNNGTLAAGSGTIVYNGSGAQNLGTYTYSTLQFGKSGGTATAAGNVTAASLVFANGNAGLVNVGNNLLTVTGNCPGSVTRSGTGHVIGDLRLTFPTGTVTCTYPVGDATNYTPITLALTGSFGGTLTGSVTAGDHPQKGFWPLSFTKYVQRYWSLDQSGDTLTVTSYNATVNWVAGDIQGGGSPASFVAAQYRASWLNPSPAASAQAATSLVIAGGSGDFSGTTTNDFVVGEAYACTPPANAPGGVTCVCDNFRRTTLNPSTIFNANWLLSTSGGSFGLPRIVNQGLLRLTDNTNNNASAATVPGIFPAAGNYISVEFKQYAYNGSGADGIAITLSDYSVPPTPGGFGGSLGYAQRTGINGFAGGWIGVSLDEFGNYTNPTEGRNGGPGFFPENVSIRGSGTGQTGYPYLAGNTNLGAFPVDDPGSTSPSRGYAYQVVIDARNYTGSNRTALVSVNRDTTGNQSTYTSLIAPFDAYVVNAAQDPVPVNWQISFTGSTGGSTNIHEIGALKVCAQTVISPNAGSSAAGFNVIDSALSNTTQNAVFGRIYMKVASAPFKLNVAALLPQSGGTSTGVNTVYASSGNRTVTVRLYDDSAGASCNSSSAACSACSKPVIATQSMTFTAADAGFKTTPSDFVVSGAYKRVIAQVTDATSAPTVIGCSTDAFSIRPAFYALTSSVSAATKAGAAFTITASPRDVNGNAVSNAASVTPGQPTLDNTKAPAAGGNQTLLLQSWNAGATAGSFVYNDVGSFSLPANAIYDRQFGNFSGEAQDQTNGDCLPGTGTSPYVPNLCYGYSGTTCTNATPFAPATGGKYACDIGSLPLNNVGRFYPDHYEAQTQLTAGCAADGFTYMGQPFSIQRSGGGVIQVKALAAGQTYNSAPGLPSYSTGYSPLASVWFGAQNGTGSTTDLMRCISGTLNTSANRCALSTFPTKGAASSSWTAGVYSAPATTVYFDPPKDTATTPDATWGAFDALNIGVTVLDSDGATLTIPGGQSFVLNSDTYQSVSGASTTRVRYGRMRIDNAMGSEQVALSVPVRLEYWTGTGWAPNALDATCTSLAAPPPPAFGSNTAGSACFGSGCTSATAGAAGSLYTTRVKGVNANAVTPSYSASTFSNGVRSVVLSAPKQSGSLNFSVEAPLWLKIGPVNPTGTNPFGVIRFGTYNSRFIFLRENY